MVGLFQEIRDAAAAVAARARFVHINESALSSLAGVLAPDLDQRRGVPGDPAHLRFERSELTVAFVFTLDALNFGSGWFPNLRKRRGRSGYFSVALALRDRFDSSGSWSPRELEAIRPDEIAETLGQDLSDPQVAELMALYARSLVDLGRWVEGHGGDFEACLALAGGRAARLVELLAEMPFYRDVAQYAGRPVPFFKRAQITVADLACAFEGRGSGSFHDLDDLTIFADNLVPHVLRCERVLEIEAGLAERIDAGLRIEPGSPEEVEIRAVAIHAVEMLAADLSERGIDGAQPWRLDQLLWTRGQQPEFKSHPRHRTRSVYY